MARATTDIMTAWVHRDGRIEVHPGVGFPDGKLPLCCGKREALKATLRQRARRGPRYAVPALSDTMPGPTAFG